MRLSPASRDVVLNTVEGQLSAQEFEELPGRRPRDVRLEIQKVKVWLVGYHACCARRRTRDLGLDGIWETVYRERVRGV